LGKKFYKIVNWDFANSIIGSNKTHIVLGIEKYL